MQQLLRRRQVTRLPALQQYFTECRITISPASYTDRDLDRKHCGGKRACHRSISLHEPSSSRPVYLSVHDENKQA